MQTVKGMAKDTKRYQYIDGLRGLAIILVIIYHAGNVTGYKTFEYFPQLYLDINNTFQYGVQLFFIVSAFTLMMSHDNRRNESQATKKFFIRRIFRIVPMWYLAIAYTTLIVLDFDLSNFNWSTFPKKALLGDLFFFNSLVPSTINRFVMGGWSITNEFTFYLCLPFICSKIKTLNGFITFSTITTLLSAFLLIVLEGTPFDINNYLTYYFFNQLPIFSLGLLAYWIVKKNGEEPIKLKVLILLAITVYIFTIINLPYPIIVSLVFFLGIIILSKKPYSIINNKYIAKIGEVSFSMYFMHFLVMYCMDWWGFHSLLTNITDGYSATLYYTLTIFLLFVPSFIISCFTYKYIEQTGQSWGRAIIKKLDSKNTPK